MDTNTQNAPPEVVSDVPVDKGKSLSAVQQNLTSDKKVDFKVKGRQQINLLTQGLSFANRYKRSSDIAINFIRKTYTLDYSKDFQIIDVKELLAEEAYHVNYESWNIKHLTFSIVNPCNYIKQNANTLFAYVQDPDITPNFDKKTDLERWNFIDSFTLKNIDSTVWRVPVSQHNYYTRYNPQKGTKRFTHPGYIVVFNTNSQKTIQEAVITVIAKVAYKVPTVLNPTQSFMQYSQDGVPVTSANFKLWRNTVNSQLLAYFGLEGEFDSQEIYFQDYIPVVLQFSVGGQQYRVAIVVQNASITKASTPYLSFYVPELENINMDYDKLGDVTVLGYELFSKTSYWYNKL